MMGHSVSGRATRTLYSHLLTPHHLLPHTRLAKPLLSRQEWNPTPRHSLLGTDVQAECFFCRGRSRLPLSPGSLAAHARVSSFTLCNSLPLFLSLPISFLSNDPVQFLNIADLPFDMNPIKMESIKWSKCIRKCGEVVCVVKRISATRRCTPIPSYLLAPSRIFLQQPSLSLKIFPSPTTAVLRQFLR